MGSKWIALVGACLVTGWCCAAEPVTVEQAAADNTLLAKSWNLCEYQSDLDGQWVGSIVASDGNCYFASSSHSSRTSAHFFKFDPRTEKITLLCDGISKICGEDVSVVDTQGKIHSPVVEMDGWLYFGTHTVRFKEANYPGAHLIGYELATGGFRDFGVLEKPYTNYCALAASPREKCVYVYLVWPGQVNDKPCLLYRVDVKTGEKRKVGELAPGGYDASVRSIYVDDQGNCWLPEEDGTLVKYDAAADKLMRYPNALPPLPPLSRGKYHRNAYWYYAAAIPGTGKAVMAASGKAYIFDPKAEQDRFRFIADIGTVHLQSQCGWAQIGSTIFFIRNFADPKAAERNLHLMSIDVLAAEPKVKDWGRITDQDGRNPSRLPALAAGPDGCLYLTGDWVALPGDKRTTRQTLDKQTQQISWPEINTSERFAYVRLPLAAIK